MRSTREVEALLTQVVSGTIMGQAPAEILLEVKAKLEQMSQEQGGGSLNPCLDLIDDSLRALRHHNPNLANKNAAAALDRVRLTLGKNVPKQPPRRLA